MAADASAFYQTLVAAVTDFNAALVGTTRMLENVYTDLKTEVTDIGRTINVPLPASQTSNISDMGTGAFPTSNPSATTVALAFSNHPGQSFVTADFSQFNTPSDVRRIFLDSYLKGILEYINNDLCSLVTTSNFNSYSAVIGRSSGLITKPEITAAWNALATAKIPVRDTGNFFLTTPAVTYGNMVGDPYWSANLQAGPQIADDARRSALLDRVWNAMVDFDQQMPATNSALTGTISATVGSTTVTGSGTAFTTETANNQWLTFADDPTGTPYQIKSRTNNTTIVLTTPYAGAANLSGSAATVTSNTCLLHHRHAIAAAFRPLPIPQGQGAPVLGTTMYLKNIIPVRVMIGYSIKDGGWVTTVDAGYARGVVRPDHGIIVTN